MSPDDDPLEAAEAAEHNTWPTPIPITTRRTPPPFPLTILPTWIRDEVINVADYVRVPRCASAQIALGVISAVLTHGNAELEVDVGWTEYPNWYGNVAMAPGSGKTPLLSKLTEPITELSDLWVETAAQAAHHVEARITVAKRELSEAEKKGSVEEIVAAMESVQLATEQSPNPRPVLGDTNAEALEQVLERNMGTAVVISDEAGPLATVARQVERGNAPNLDALLQAWSGRTISVTRLSREHHVPRARAHIQVTTQPHIVETLLRANSDFSGRGFSDRFMVAMPTSMVGTRDFTQPVTFSPEIHDEYVRRVVKIGETHRWGERAWSTYRLDRTALEAFNTWRSDVEQRRQGHDGELAPLAGMPEKVASTVLRIALALHVAEGLTTAEPVDLVSMSHAIELGEWWFAHALIAYGAPPSPQHGLAERLVDWIRRRDCESFTARDVVRSGAFRSEEVTTQDVLDAVGVLIEHEFVVPTSDDWRRTLRGSQRPSFVVNPQTLVHNLSRGDATPGDDIALSVRSPDGEGELSRMSRVAYGDSNYYSSSIDPPPTPTHPQNHATSATTHTNPPPADTDLETAARRLEQAFLAIQEDSDDANDTSP